MLMTSKKAGGGVSGPLPLLATSCRLLSAGYCSVRNLGSLGTCEKQTLGTSCDYTLLCVQEAAGVLGGGNWIWFCLTVSSAPVLGVSQSASTLWQREPWILWLGVWWCSTTDPGEGRCEDCHTGCFLLPSWGPP